MVYDSKSKGVILMEDSPGDRLILEETIRTLGFTPYPAENAQQFFQIYQNGCPYFAAILDHQVPLREGNSTRDLGLTIAKLISKREPSLRVALCTGLEKDKLPDLKQTKILYIPKPVPIEQLRDFLTRK